jgi:hypothetical protein
MGFGPGLTSVLLRLFSLGEHTLVVIFKRLVVVLLDFAQLDALVLPAIEEGLEEGPTYQGNDDSADELP